MRIRVVGTGEAVDGASSIDLVDYDRCVTALVVVVGAASKHPVGGTAGYVGEAGTEIQRTAGCRTTCINTGTRTCCAVCRCVIGAGEAVDCAVGVCLTDDDACIATLVVVVSAASKDPMRRPTGYVGEAGAEVE